jgi:hypothetical protein
MGLRLVNTLGLSSSVHFAHIACYWSFCTIYKSSVSTGFAKQIMHILRILCYNGTVVTWTVVSLFPVRYELNFCILFRRNSVYTSRRPCYKGQEALGTCQFSSLMSCPIKRKGTREERLNVCRVLWGKLSNVKIDEGYEVKKMNQGGWGKQLGSVGTFADAVMNLRIPYKTNFLNMKADNRLSWRPFFEHRDLFATSSPLCTWLSYPLNDFISNVYVCVTIMSQVRGFPFCSGWTSVCSSSLSTCLISSLNSLIIAGEKGFDT